MFFCLFVCLFVCFKTRLAIKAKSCNWSFAVIISLSHFRFTRGSVLQILSIPWPWWRKRWTYGHQIWDESSCFVWAWGLLLTFLCLCWSWHEPAVVNVMHASAVRNEKGDSYLLVNLWVFWPHALRELINAIDSIWFVSCHSKAEDPVVPGPLSTLGSLVRPHTLTDSHTDFGFNPGELSKNVLSRNTCNRWGWSGRGDLAGEPVGQTQRTQGAADQMRCHWVNKEKGDLELSPPSG